MSRAADLIAEVTELLGDVEQEVLDFEADDREVGAWTDIAQLNKAKIHLGMLRDSLRNQRADTEAAQAAAEEVAAEAPRRRGRPPKVAA